MNPTVKQPNTKTRIHPTPAADTSPLAKLSFIKRQWDGRTKTYLTTEWLDIPLEEYGAGNITGYRVLGELMAWTQAHPSHGDLVIRSVLEAAQAVLSQPFSVGYDVPCKRGAAAVVVLGMIDLLKFAALHADHASYCETKANRLRDYLAKDREREATARREFVERMKQARANKRAARLAMKGGAV